MSVRADVLGALIRDLLDEPTLSIIREEPGLAWIEAPLRSALDTMTPLLAGEAKDNQAKALRDEAGEWDNKHDSVKRYLYRLLEAVAVHYAREDLASSAALLRNLLFPIGLNAVNVTFRRQVAAAEAFSERLKRTDVAAAITLLQDAGYDVVPSTQTVIAAADGLRAVLRQIDQLDAEKTGAIPNTALFTARNEAQYWLSVLMNNVGAVLRGDDPENKVKRERFYTPWRKVRAEAARRNDKATVAELDATLPPEEGSGS